MTARRCVICRLSGLAEVAAHDGVTLVFLDEVNTAAPATQNALMRMVQEHRVGYLHLGERVRFIAAANPATQNSGAWDLSAPLANRFAHLHWPLHVNEWQSGYLDGWPTLMPLDIDAAPSPAAVRCQRRLQTAFVARRPQLLCDPPDGFSVAAGVAVAAQLGPSRLLHRRRPTGPGRRHRVCGDRYGAGR